jgi:hypothetical protein
MKPEWIADETSADQKVNTEQSIGIHEAFMRNREAPVARGDRGFFRRDATGVLT